ncbi:PREDICTED: uncharacterized protein LOC106808813 [Priapulus caudatus]|uniref:Uncharacterized protein LOC106808813 n=1 Tax=Priapulus caudatus TaxID=37621 RepID=A0ABM1E4P0_PRICU|nr:PREDICTED: uncharacterized protein LOC106808813 [Priapulus caudatus]
MCVSGKIFDIRYVSVFVADKCTRNHYQRGLIGASKAGPSYGKKMMTGHLASQGIHAAESQGLVAHITMPVRSSSVLEYGMWEQVRVDHGTEFYSSLYVQEKNADLRCNQHRQPYIQTQSKRNHKFERMGPEDV